MDHLLSRLYLENPGSIVLSLSPLAQHTVGQYHPSQLKIIGVEPMIYRRSWAIEAMMGAR